jgi:PAS domain S-box-containing protein
MGQNPQGFDRAVGGISASAQLPPAILNSIADGVFTVDLAWRITSFNRAAQRITGYTADDVIGRRCFDVFHANVCDRGCALRRAMETGQDVVNYRVDIGHRAGRTVPVSVSASLLRDPEGRVLGSVETIRDLSVEEATRVAGDQEHAVRGLLGNSAGMRRVLRVLPDVAASDSIVLITGEVGTGKHRLARTIHELSPRCEGPFIRVNCSDLPDALLQAEPSAHSGENATHDRHDDRVRATLAETIAETGTIFLEDIETSSAPVQLALLRMLQGQEDVPGSAVRPQRPDVRVIAASNAGLAELVEQGGFRRDLFQLLNVVSLELPPLRRRREDIPLLVEYFVAELNAAEGRNVSGLSAAALRVLIDYDFPGNVRELANVLEHAFVLCRSGQIEVEHFPPMLAADAGRAAGFGGSDLGPLAAAAAREIRAALERNKGHRGNTARELGISPSTLWRKMKRLGIED